MGPTYSLQLQTPRQLYEKLQREAANLDILVNGDNVFNFMVTAWHLIEWIEKATPNKSKAFRDDLDALRRQVFLQICRDICNASKHLHLNYPDKTVEEVTVIPGSIVPRYGRDRYGHPGQRKTTISVGTSDATFDIGFIKDEVLRLYNEFDQKHQF